MKEPNLDQWTTGFALVAFLGLFIAPLLYSQAGQRKTQVRYVVTILVLFSVVLLYYVLWWSRYLQFFPYVNGIPELFFFLFGPLFYLYLEELTQQPVASRARRWHFLPFLVALLVQLPFLLMPPAQRHALQEAAGRGTPGFYAYYHAALPWLYLGHLSVYAVAIARLQGTFGALRQVAHWARWFSLSYLGFVLANWSYYVLVQMDFFTRTWDYGISFSMAGFIALVAVLAYVQPYIFQHNQFPSFERVPATVQPPAFPTQLPPMVPPQAATAKPRPEREPAPQPEPEARYRNSGLPPHLAVRLARQLDQLMRTEKLYRLSDLRLNTLAARLNLGRHHLSQVLNEQLGMNFFEYINALRIEEAKELLSHTSRQQLNIIEVAYEVGFNNKVSFNKAFKNSTGLTPSEFRQSAQGNPGRDYRPTPIASG
ncbi:helix-turn-helix domain-containing protein [Hymenobacter terricola]|uniref:helix-turn-helix domain-containing protein n=1 Tax=Hymenobacter terricola TaxID=2819236 RepID=UPI001B3158A2|nr:helix-turn-helix domain-containing protein [Hymenobacter terricola]